MPTQVRFEAGSYRDRDGRVFYGEDGEVYRALSRQALSEWEAVRAARFFKKAMADGRVVRTDMVARPPGEREGYEETWAAVLQHEPIPFVSYPYEWSFGMLKDAALLHLDLLQAALDANVTLKDGTAYNVQFVGSRPVFIDVASFERLAAGQPWAGYRQFCQTFLYPLLLQAYKNIAFHSFLRGCLAGISPVECARLMSLRDLVRPGVLTHVWLHARLEADRGLAQNNLQQALPRAGFDKALIKNNIAGLARIINRLNWSPSESTWSTYAGNNTYSEGDRRRKAAFVREAVASRPPDLVWDLGCNTGEYSLIAAEHARYVVAMDADHLAVERLYQFLKSPSRPAAAGTILPLVSNVADPAPNLGWRGAERKSLEARGRPDLTLCLALVHHLVIDAGIPLHDLLAWLAGLGTDLVIEFVAKGDSMVEALLRNRRDACADYGQEHFEQCLNEFFDVARSEALESGTRTLYHALARPTS
ncbi:MAG: methyltransferase [Deltaproteobacteria bacterium]